MALYVIIIIMTKEFYERITAVYKKRPKLLKAVKILNFGITGLTMALYAGLLAWLFISKDQRFVRVFLTPGLSFLVVSAMREIIHAKRPYEVLDIKPLIPKNRKGGSFPSRHAYSTYVIAMSFYYICPPLGIVFFVLGALMAYIRVIGGMHFPRDVIAGVLIGILSGAIGFYIIPAL